MEKPQINRIIQIIYYSGLIGVIILTAYNIWKKGWM